MRDLEDIDKWEKAFKHGNLQKLNVYKDLVSSIMKFTKHLSQNQQVKWLSKSSHPKSKMAAPGWACKDQNYVGGKIQSEHELY